MGVRHETASHLASQTRDGARRGRDGERGDRSAIRRDGGEKRGGRNRKWERSGARKSQLQGRGQEHPDGETDARRDYRKRMTSVFHWVAFRVRGPYFSLWAAF